MRVGATEIPMVPLDLDELQALLEDALELARESGRSVLADDIRKTLKAIKAAR